MSEENANQVKEKRYNDARLDSPLCRGGCHKLDSYDWLKEVSGFRTYSEVIEVRFKNTRKGFYANVHKLPLSEGDIVAVEASPGHDIGIVSTAGQIVKIQLMKQGINLDETELKKIYRKAKSADIDKWKEAIALEHSTMLKARKISEDLDLEMKIGDVEYQGDKTKAIFYYIADDRVDFRQLIKVLAEEFKIRIEMRQIGARQEAGRIGGIGSCGRELCCSSWITNFVSVTTNAARFQEVSLNPQKLAGQCSKLKCCLNYELDAYLDMQESFPDTTVALQTKKGAAYHRKTDVFKRLMWYAYEQEHNVSVTCMSVEHVNEIIKLNKKGIIPEKLTGIEESAMTSVIEYQNSAGIESLSRFEDKPESSGKPDKKRKHRPPHKKRYK
jgi:cell fate regulator YaaT (PSP1 superfamily)